MKITLKAMVILETFGRRLEERPNSAKDSTLITRR